LAGWDSRINQALTGESPHPCNQASGSVQRDPEALVRHWVHGLVAQWHVEYDEAIAAFKKAADVSDRAEYPLTQLTVAYAECGRLGEARAIHDELQARRARGHVLYLTQSITAAAIGDTDTAIELAHQSCDEREPLLVLFARNFPTLRRLREDPRFADVLRRLALPHLDS
jgi:hypothetical protein